jgi:hypothetical protein
MNGLLMIAGAILTTSDNLMLYAEMVSGTKIKANLGVIAGVILVIYGFIG